ncbi:8-oxo-dGTP diphosphatase MutT [Alteromonadaceae bacterium M269]|nr:8-oxo-dGTP diphosphatase MutT [Alteromonadaceae bacterium M269]
MKRVDVAVGVIIRERQIYITKRADDLHQGGKWEFPGGKKEADETIAEALVRELLEEIGIEVQEQSELLVIEHDYGDKKVCLDVRLVTSFDNEPHGAEGQQGQWVSIENLLSYDFPEANTAIIDALFKRYDVKLSN